MPSRPGPASWSRPVLLLGLLGLAPAPALAHAPVRADPAARLLSLEFTSDHNLLCHNTRDLLSAGERYPDVEWQREPRVNAPITHTGGTCRVIHARVTLAVTGAPAGSAFLLEGRSPEPALCFRAQGRLPAGSRVAVDVQGAGPLGKAVRKVRQPVRWTLTLDPGGPARRKLELGQTGPHTVYTTLGAPKNTRDPLSAVTDVRMDLAVRTVAAAQARAGEGASPPRIVHELMKQFSDYYVSTRHYGRENAWKVAECLEMEPRGASCISIVEFVRLVCDMIGLEGRVSTVAFYALADDPFRALPGGLGDAPVTKPGDDGTTWQLFLVDVNNTNEGQVGGVGGMNYYEAALRYDRKGVTYYYPGGTEFVYDSPDKVLRVFRTLAWARWDVGAGGWVVMEVACTYTRSGKDRPASMPLP